MSTYWGYVCKSHEPPIESEHWFNHGYLTLEQVFRKERAGEWPDQEDVMHRGYATKEPIQWLRQHPHCEVALRNEYGDEYDPEETSP